MVGNILLRGMLVGLLAGVIAFGFARVFGEPQVDLAIAFEEAQSAAAAKAHTQSEVQSDAKSEVQSQAESPAHSHSHSHDAAGSDAAEPELVSRATQAGAGLLTGLLVYSAAVGGLFSLVFAFVYGRFGSSDARATAALLALAAFVSLVLVPALKYPPNPPAVGDPDTIVMRTELYFLMLAASVSSLVLAFSLARIVRGRLGSWNAMLTGAAVYVALIGAVCTALPAINEVPEHFSASVLWNFRTASLGIHLILWSVLGLVFGMTVEQRLTTVPRERRLAT
jgi:predicted cobalt transporter CbtA